MSKSFRIHHSSLDKACWVAVTEVRSELPTDSSSFSTPCSRQTHCQSLLCIRKTTGLAAFVDKTKITFMLCCTANKSSHASVVKPVMESRDAISSQDSSIFTVLVLKVFRIVVLVSVFMITVLVSVLQLLSRSCVSRLWVLHLETLGLGLS